MERQERTYRIGLYNNLDLYNVMTLKNKETKK